MTQQDDWSIIQPCRAPPTTAIPERLLSAGLELFLQQGYNATGIQQLTDLAGVPKGSFYNHFASKEAFAAAIVARYAQNMQRSWERMMQSAPPHPMDTIRHVFAQMLGYHERADCSAGCLIGNFAAEIALSSEAGGKTARRTTRLRERLSVADRRPASAIAATSTHRLAARPGRPGRVAAAT